MEKTTPSARHGMALGKSLAPQGQAAIQGLASASVASASVSVVSDYGLYMSDAVREGTLASLPSTREASKDTCLPEDAAAERLARQLRPFSEQLTEQGVALKQLQQTVSGFSRRLEDLLHEEARKADIRLRLQEAFLRQHAETVTKANTSAATDKPATPPPTESPRVDALVPLETALERMEVLMAGQQRQLEIAAEMNRAGSKPACDRLRSRESEERRGLRTPFRSATSRSSSRRNSRDLEGGSPTSSIKLVRTPASESDRENTSESLPLELPPAPVYLSHVAEGSAEASMMAQSKPLESKQRLEKRPTFLGIYLDEVPCVTTSRKCVELAMSGMDWFHKLKEPPRSGELANMVTGTLFKVVCSFVILANVVFLIHTTNFGMEAAAGQEEGHNIVIEAGNIVFLSFYSCELLLKLSVHRAYFFVGPDTFWNVFDLAVVIMSIYSQFFAFLLSRGGSHTRNAAALRAVKLLKIVQAFRVVQLLRVFNDLRMMLKVVLSTALTFVWTLVVMCSIYYLVAVTFVQLLTSFLIDQGSAVSSELRQDICTFFFNVQTAMLSLFKATFGGTDWDVVYQVLVQTGWVPSTIFILFVAFVRISLMNTFMALFVEHTMKRSQPDLMEQVRFHLEREKKEARDLKTVLTKMGFRGSISVAEFEAMLETTQLKYYLAALGLDVQNTEEVFNALADVNDGEHVNLDTFVDSCMRLRGHASGVDAQNLMMEARMIGAAQQKYGDALIQKLDTMAEHVNRDRMLHRKLETIAH